MSRVRINNEIQSSRFPKCGQGGKAFIRKGWPTAIRASYGSRICSHVEADGISGRMVDKWRRLWAVDCLRSARRESTGYRYETRRRIAGVTITPNQVRELLQHTADCLLQEAAWWQNCAASNRANREIGLFAKGIEIGYQRSAKWLNEQSALLEYDEKEEI